MSAYMPKKCQNRCQIKCPMECQHIYKYHDICMYINVYIMYSIFHSWRYVQNYVRIICQGGDPSKKVESISFFVTIDVFPRFACLLTNFFAQPRRHEGFLHPVPPGQRGSCASAARAAAAGAGAPSRAFDPAAGDSGAARRAQVAGCGE